MKTKTFVWLLVALFVCSSCERSSINPDDPTKFSSSSIVGIWACIASDNKTYDVLSGQTNYHWDYDPDAQTYAVNWYFNIQSDSKVEYVNVTNAVPGEYRKSDGCLHIPANSKWASVIDANYIFDEGHQAIICPSGKVFGFTVESVADVLGSDTIFYVRRYAIDEAVIYDNTGFLKSQYVVRVKGIKEDL